MAKKVLQRLRITELSAVDRPAQTHAKMTIIKRAKGDAIMSDEIAKIDETIIKAWIDPQDGAKPFSTFLENTLSNKQYWKVMDIACDYVYALDDSLKSIIGDDDLTVAEKESQMRNSVEEFLASIRSKWPDIEEAFTKVLADPDSSKIVKGAKMSREKVTVEDLQKKVEDLKKQLDAATDASEDAKKAAEMQAKNDELTKQLEDLKAELDMAKAESALSDEEKAYMSDKDEKTKKAFMDMSAEDRQKAIAKSIDTDEVIKFEGNEIRKSVVGDEQFAVFKAMAKKAEETDKKLSEETNKREQIELTKRAEDEFGHLPGEVESKVDVLRSINKIDDEDTRKCLEKMLEAGDKAIKAAFDTIGHDKETLKKTENDFKKKVAEIKKRDECSQTEAMQKARQEYPEEFAAFQGEDENTSSAAN